MSVFEFYPKNTFRECDLIYKNAYYELLYYNWLGNDIAFGKWRFAVIMSAPVPTAIILPLIIVDTIALRPGIPLAG